MEKRLYIPIERELPLQAERIKSQRTEELPLSLMRYAFWRDGVSRQYDHCISCTNGGSGDCVACRG